MKRGPVYPEKLAIPRLRSVFPRERLFSQIDASLDCSALWITGIPGAGKTTLMASYVKSRKVPCLWYQVDGGDDDIASFFDYFSSAAERFMTDSQFSFPLFRPEYFHSIASFSRRFFRHCLKNLKTPLVVVLDDYHETDPGSVLHEVIGTAITEAPEGITFVILSREEPPGQMQRLLMNRIMGLIDASELKLNMEETLDFANFHSEMELEATTVKQVYQQTDGWIAGMVLMLEALDTDLDVLKCREMTKGFFFNYFAGEIFQKKMGSTMQEFLMKIALFRTVTTDGARVLTGNDDAGNILSEMSRKQYFVSRKTESNDVYKLHPLFREFLLWKMKERFTLAEIVALRQKAAEWLVAEGEFDDAFDLYLSVQDWQEIAALIHQRAREMITRQRLQTLGKWLTVLPEEQLSSSPWLLYWKGICRIPFNPFESGDYFTRAFGRFQEMKETEGMLLSVAGAIEAIMASWGDFKEVDSWIERIGKMLEKGISFPSVEVETRTAFAMFTALMFRQPDHPDMGYWEEKILDLIQSDLDVAQKALLGEYLSHYRFWTGDISGAGIIMDILREITLTGEVPPLVFLTFKMQEAVYYWHISEFDACINAVEEGLKAGDETGVQIIDAWLLAQAAYASLSTNDLSRAESYLERIKPVLRSKRILDISHYHYLMAWYHLLKGEV
jgi:ATP/maltotriose-dependent transcriptional regulator MalT